MTQTLYQLTPDSEAIHIVQVATSKLVWDCHQSLIQLGKHNRVPLIWVPGHEGVVGNETADQLARTGSEYPFIGTEPAFDISIGVAKKVVRDWTIRNHKIKSIGNSKLDSDRLGDLC
jgi:hypothetical protein